MIRPAGFALVSRMALLDPHIVDIKNPMIRGERIIGWTVNPDELWTPKEGFRMVRAIELTARLNFPAMKARMLEMDGI